MFLLFMGIVYTSHFQHGFFMNWFGNQKGEGYEYFLLAMGISASLVFTGGGKFSLDGFFSKMKKKPLQDSVRRRVSVKMS